MSASALLLVALPAILALGAPAPAWAQTPLAARIAAAGDGVVRMSFAARPDVCGSPGGGIITDRSDEDGWTPDCDRGPVRVALTVRDGSVRALRVHLAGHWVGSVAGGHDLGRVGARAAAAYLLALARSGAGDRVGAAAIEGAALADSAVIWPALADLARRGAGARRRTRSVAMFWLAQRAAQAAAPRGRRPGGSVGAEAESATDQVRRAAIFALSQQPQRVAVPALLKAYHQSREPAIRRSILFWLGQSGDPRAIDLFVSILKH